MLLGSEEDLWSPREVSSESNSGFKSSDGSLTDSNSSNTSHEKLILRQTNVLKEEIVLRQKISRPERYAVVL